MPIDRVPPIPPLTPPETDAASDAPPDADLAHAADVLADADATVQADLHLSLIEPADHAEDAAALRCVICHRTIRLPGIDGVARCSSRPDWCADCCPHPEDKLS